MTAANKKVYDAFIGKMRTEVVYFRNTFEDAVIKSTPLEGYLVKFKGREPFTATDSNSVVAEGILEYNEISKKEFDRF